MPGAGPAAAAEPMTEAGGDDDFDADESDASEELAAIAADERQRPSTTPKIRHSTSNQATTTSAPVKATTPTGSSKTTRLVESADGDDEPEPIKPVDPEQQ